MTTFLSISQLFAALFFIGMFITIVLWFVFFAEVKKLDIELYNSIRFRWTPTLKTPYSRFVFKKEYKNSQHEPIRRYAGYLYLVGVITQWCFNIFITMTVLLLAYIWVIKSGFL